MIGLFVISVIGGAVVINRFLKTSNEMEASAQRLLSEQATGHNNRRISSMFSESEHVVVSNVIVRLILNQTQILGLILKFNLKWPEAVVMVFDGTDNVMRY